MFNSAGNRLELAPPEGVPGMLSAIAPLVDTESCETILPTSKVFAPASVISMETGDGAVSRSPTLPAHPVVGGWLGMEVGHCVCWSAWEKSCGGTCCVPPRYWVRV